MPRAKSTIAISQKDADRAAYTRGVGAEISYREVQPAIVIEILYGHGHRLDSSGKAYLLLERPIAFS